MAPSREIVEFDRVRKACALGPRSVATGSKRAYDRTWWEFVFVLSGIARRWGGEGDHMPPTLLITSPTWHCLMSFPSLMWVDGMRLSLFWLWRPSPSFVTLHLTISREAMVHALSGNSARHWDHRPRSLASDWQWLLSIRSTVAVHNDLYEKMDWHSDRDCHDCQQLAQNPSYFASSPFIQSWLYSGPNM